MDKLTLLIKVSPFWFIRWYIIKLDRSRLVLNQLSENSFIFALLSWVCYVKDRWSFFFSIKTGQFISGIEKEIISIKCGQTKKTWDSSEHLDYPKKTRYLIFNWPIVHVKADGNRAVLSLESATNWSATNQVIIFLSVYSSTARNTSLNQHISD